MIAFLLGIVLIEIVFILSLLNRLDQPSQNEWCEKEWYLPNKKESQEIEDLLLDHYIDDCKEFYIKDMEEEYIIACNYHGWKYYVVTKDFEKLIILSYEFQDEIDLCKPNITF